MDNDGYESPPSFFLTVHRPQDTRHVTFFQLDFVRYGYETGLWVGSESATVERMTRGSLGR